MTVQKMALLHRARSHRVAAALILTAAMLFVAAAIPAAHAQTFTQLYDFSGTPSNPAFPTGPLVQGRDGNLYGSASGGGGHSKGALYKLTPTGSLTLLCSFDKTHGGDPEGGLTMGVDGNFYGTTYRGGTMDFGTIYKVTPGGNLTVLYNFTGSSDGGNPLAPPIQGPNGSFYGTTYSGGLGWGTVYRIKTTSEVTVLHQLDAVTGEQPWAPLILAANGSFYGTTWSGGSWGEGTVYRMSQAGDITVVYAFDYSIDGYPKGPVVQGSDGNFYGVSPSNINFYFRYGDVFQLTPAGDYKVLHEFYQWDGETPLVGLVQATDGNFYGATYGGGLSYWGVLYRIKSDGAFAKDHDFGGDDGKRPNGLFQHTNGLLYGTANQGGADGYGTFFSLDVGAPPFVRLVSSSAQVSKSIGILGQGFTGTSSVSFNGIPASFTVSSDTYLETVVPDGALTGSVTVTTPTGTLTSNTPFRVTPKILSFNPTSGAPGTPVIITGTGLTQTSKVGFGGIPAANFTIDSDTQVTAIVPEGAVTGKLAIVTEGGHDASARVFTVMQ